MRCRKNRQRRRMQFRRRHSGYQRMRIEVLQCEVHASVYVQEGMETGGIFYRHLFLSTDSLSAWQFAQELNQRAERNKFFGESRDHVAPFSCDNKIVALTGFDARVTTACARIACLPVFTTSPYLSPASIKTSAPSSAHWICAALLLNRE